MNHPYFPAARRRPLHRASHLLSLEQRFMFDGAAVADAAHAAQVHEAAAAVPPAVVVRAAEPAKDDGKKEVVLVDTSVANYKTLEAGVREGVGIVEFDGSKDGLAQIAQWAAGQSGLDAIHILSHGSEGTINLGTARLTDASLSSATVQAELAQLGQALSADGDLLLYGCDVAAGDHNALIADLARITGADVAASRDATGAAALGGDWTLETHAGKIDTKALDIADYQGLLTVISFSGSDADYSSTTVVKQVNGQDITFSGGANAGGLGIDLTYGTGGLYAYQGPINEIKLTVSVTTGYTFDISSFDVGVMTGSLTIDLTYGDNTTATVVLNSLANSWQTLLNSSLGNKINDVKQVVFSSSDFGLFQNFDITDVKAVPHPPTVTVSSASLSADTGTSSSDFVTNTASQTISGTLSTTLSTGEKVQVSYDNGSNWSDATSYTVGSSSWSTTTTLAGSNTFQARVTNADGSSTAYTHSYTLDSTAPTTTFSNVSLSNDSGSSNTDLVTNSSSQTVTATLSTALVAGDKLEASVNGGTTWVDVTSKVSGTTLSWNGVTLANGSNNLSFRVTDLAGNVSTVTSRAYTVDSVAPTTTIATAGFSSDSGASGTDFVTNVGSQTISGTLSANLVAGEIVYVSVNGGATWATASTTVGQNTWSLSGATLVGGSNTLRVKVSDLAGNDSTLFSQAYTYDTTAPTTTLGSLALSADSGTAADFITNVTAQTVTGTLGSSLAAGDILYGSVDGGATWSDITNKVSGTTLTWTGVTLLDNTSSSLQFKITDLAGNTGSTTTRSYTVDRNAPATPPAPLLDSASDSGLSNSDQVTSDTTPTLTGTAEAGSKVEIYDGATLLGSTTATGGVWSYTAGALGDSTHSITVKATDTAGNISAASGALSITIDSGTPAVSSVAVPANGTYYTGDALDITVNYNEAVYVDTSGGTPRIAMVIGATTRYASYVSGSGTSALVFRYSVVNGDVDSNGITIGALTANGGTLSDLAGNAGDTTLNSVGSTAAILVDGTQPSVTNTSASTADGSYGAGQVITITVGFSGAVDVDTSGGTPTLALASGGSATYSGGSGSSTLTFSYTVGAGDNSADLDYTGSGALALNGATIKDSGGAHLNAAIVLAAPGTAGSLGANKAIIIDTLAPAITGATAVFSADTGTSATDLVTRTTTQTLSGTLSGSLGSGEGVQVSLDNGGHWQNAIASGSTWSLSGQTLTQSDTLQVRVVDAAGNIGSAASFAYVLDTTAPATTFSNIALSGDSGASSSDLITNVAPQTITATLSGALAAGDRVYGSLNNGATWTDITGKVSGTTLSWNGVTLSSSDTLLLRVTDLAGNIGTATSRAYVLDTTAPTTSVASAQFSADSGSSNSDFITNVAAQTVSGTLSANLAADEAVYVSLDNGATWHAASTTAGQNTWSLAGQTLSASDTLLVKVSDTAGNDGSVYSQAYTYDTTAPAAATVTTLNTMSLTPTLAGTATLAAGDTLAVTVGGATYQVTPAAGAWTLDLGSATPASGTLLLVMDTQYEVVATITDSAGNHSSDSTAGELVIGNPAPPVVAPTTSASGASLSADSGSSGSDWITNVAAQTLSGSLSAPLQAGETVQVSLDGGASWGSAAASGSSWSYGGTLAEGSNSVQVRVSGPGGTGPVYSHDYTLDTTPPATPVADAQSTTALTPVLSGSATLASGDTLTVTVGGAQYAVGVSGGRWSLDLASATPLSGSLALSAGNHYDVVATVTDLAGNRSSASAQLNIDFVPLPVVTSLAISADSGTSSSDFVTNVAAQTVSGKLSAALTAGQVVEVSADGGASWTSASSSGTSWSAAVTLGGSSSLVARVSGGGRSSAALQQAYVLDTAAPAATPVLGALGTDGTVSGSLSAPLGSGETLLVSRDGGASWSALATSGQGWSLASNGSSSVQLLVRDTAGNSGATLTVDTSVPPAQPVQPVPPVVPVVAPVVPATVSPVAGDASTTQPEIPLPASPLVVTAAGGAAVVLSGWSDTPARNVLDSLPTSVTLQAQQPAALGTNLPVSDTGTGDSGFRAVTLPQLPGGAGLIAYTPIADVRSTSGQRLSVQIGSDAFAQTGDSSVQLSATMANGTALPGWLKFDGRTGRFEGTPPLGFEGTLSFKVVARDSQGRMATQVFKIVVSKDGAKRADAPVGRSSFGEQLRSARDAGAARLAVLSA